MSDKFCPVGKIGCDCFTLISSSIPSSHPDRCSPDSDQMRIIDGYEQCPWPSRQKKVQSKYEKAWDVLINNPKTVTLSPQALQSWKADFVQALKEAGL